MRLVQKGLIEETANPFHRLPTIATSNEDHAAPMRELHNRMTVLHDGLGSSPQLILQVKLAPSCESTCVVSIDDAFEAGAIEFTCFIGRDDCV